MIGKLDFREQIIPLLLMLASFILSISVTWGVFDAVPHLEDEHANLFQAKIIATGNWVNSQPKESDSFFVPFIINSDGKQFSKYPPGYAIVLALGVILGYPWLINSIAAALTVLATFLLGKQLFDTDSGLLAAALAVISPMHIMLSGTLLSHSISICWLTFFAFLFCKCGSEQSLNSIWISSFSGLFLGLAFITRPWTAIAIGLPFAILTLFRLPHMGRNTRRKYLLMLGSFLLVSSIWMIYNQTATGNPFTNTYQMWWDYDAIGFGPEKGRFGYTPQKMLTNLMADLPIFNNFVLGWPGGAFISVMGLVILMALILPQYTRKEISLLMPVFSLIAAYSMYWAHSGGLYGVRYYAEAMPFLWLVCARGLIKLFRFTPSRWIIRFALPAMMIWNVFFVLYPSFREGKNLYNINRQDYQNIIQADLNNAIVFVKADYWTDYANLSWGNHPDPAKGNIIFAIDGGEMINLNVIEAYPGRQVYYYDRDREPPLLSN